jgi:hypothetical protein
MIDEIDYFPKRDKYKKKGGALDSEWDALKKTKTRQDSAKVKPGKKAGKEAKPGKKKPPETDK